MKKLIQSTLAYKYKKDLDKLEYSLTHDEGLERLDKSSYQSKILEIEQLYNKLPFSFKVEKLSSINRYTQSDDPVLSSNHERSNLSYHIILKTYVLNILEKENLTQEEKKSIFGAVNRYMKVGQKDEFAASLGSSLNSLQSNKSKKI